MADILIRLTPQELATARRCAELRQTEARRDGFKRYGLGSIETDTLGMLGEIAVDRYLGLPPRTHMTYLAERRQHFDTQPPGAVQARARPMAWHGLGYRSNRDCPWCPYICAYVQDSGEIVKLRGWATGEQIESEGRLIEKPGFPFFVLPPHRLHPLPADPPPYFYLEQTICRKMRAAPMIRNRPRPLCWGQISGNRSSLAAQVFPR